MQTALNQFLRDLRHVTRHRRRFTGPKLRSGEWPDQFCPLTAVAEFRGHRFAIDRYAEAGATLGLDQFDSLQIAATADNDWKSSVFSPELRRKLEIATRVRKPNYMLWAGVIAILTFMAAGAFL